MPASSIFWPTFWMGAALVLAKAAHWGVPSFTARGLSDYACDVAVSSHEDVAFVVAVGLLAQLAVLATAQLPRVKRLIPAGLTAFGTASIVYAVVSVRMFAYFQAPLTYRLRYFVADITLLRPSLGPFLSTTLGLALVAAPLFYLLAVRATRQRPPWRGIGAALGAAALAAWIGYGWSASGGKWGDRDDHWIAASPHRVMLESLLQEALAGRAPELERSVRAEDLDDFVSRPRAARLVPASLGRVPARPKNLILLVLESTGAEWLHLYGSPYKATPRLDAEAAHALVFDNFYCHVGLSANSIVAIGLSTLPYLTWREYTSEYPELPGATLADILKPRGFRTAFIHSGDVDFAGQRRFLAHRGFDAILGLKELAPEKFDDWGADDRIVVDGLFKWIDEDRERPFYVMAWTMESHWPYEPAAAHHEIDFFHGDLPPDDYDLGRYLNTLHDADSQFGRIVDGLRERGLADDTLIAVTADHGEGFGAPHPSWGHGSRIYQENVHVPFLLWSPTLFPKPERSRVIGGHLDINPTLTDVLGLPPDPSWLGRSMFEVDRPPRAYFYAVTQDYLLGVRDGDWKYIYNATRGSEELYDLAQDPREQKNVTDAHAERSSRLRQRLAAWIGGMRRTQASYAR